MRSTIDIRVRVPITDIIDAMADEVAREVERQMAPFVAMPMPSRSSRSIPPGATVEVAIGAVIDAITRLENSMHTRDEVAAIDALRRAALALRAARRQQIKKENLDA